MAELSSTKLREESYGREVKDEEEDDPAKQADAENDEEDEEEDEDYVPEEQDEDDDSDDGGGFEEIDEVGPDEGGVEKRGKRGTASKDKQNRRPKRLKLGTVPPVQELNSPVSAEEEAARLAAAEKARADALWAELQSNTEPARKKSAADVTAPATKAITTSLTKPSASALDIKALLAKTKNSAGVAKSADSGMVTITQKLDFCGEEVVVTKRVRAGSKEELAHRELGGDVLKPKTAEAPKIERGSSSASSGEALQFKPALPPPKLLPKPSGLAGLLATLDGKKKMTTMEKSRHDWGNFKEKQDESTRAEMERFAKDGYLEKMAFLQRADERQAAVARTNRRRGMGLKD